MLKKSDILDFIRSVSAPVTKREVARGFGIKGGENRVALKQILKALEAEEAIIKQPGGAYSVPKGLPGVCVVEVCEITADGDVFARPVDWSDEVQGEAPRIEIVPDKKHFAHMKDKARALVRLSRQSETLYEAKIIKALDYEKSANILGIVRYTKHGPILAPTDKKAKYDFDINPGDLNGAQEGDLAVGEVQRGRGIKRKRVRITEILGKQGDPQAISLISLYEAGLSEEFPDTVLDAAKGLKVPPLKGREDLRDYPLVTIDGADARDFDDAVFAEKTDNGGFHLIVAIADVAYYVRPNAPLDIEAQKRGNSTYFPDRVVPMLPEALSNDLCSLRPHEDRACMAVHLYIDADGQMTKYKFVRGLMKSKARLVYEQVQYYYDQINASPSNRGSDELFEKIPDQVRDAILVLYEAYRTLDAARQKRGALDLDLPERQILIDERGQMIGVKPRLRLDAHKLIEEFMILANVAAASALEAKRDAQSYPCVYRIHDRPKSDRLDEMRDFVESFGISLPKGQVMQSGQINGILRQAAKTPYSHLISQVILRSQAQAVYSPDNIGHFGLALQRYAHFTSPIRRYADLLVHRSLINAYDLGPGGLSDEEIARLDEICGHISSTERTSMEAERSAVDRFTSSYLSEQVGAEFAGRITGVTRFGLFVELLESGADGLVPMKSLSDDFYIHDEKGHALVGRKNKKLFRLGAPVTVRITEADGLTGSLVLRLSGKSMNGADIPGVRFKSRVPDEQSHRRGGKNSRGRSNRSQRPPSKGGFKKSGGRKHSGPPSKRK